MRTHVVLFAYTLWSIEVFEVFKVNYAKTLSLECLILLPSPVFEFVVVGNLNEFDGMTLLWHCSAVIFEA